MLGLRVLVVDNGVSVFSAKARGQDVSYNVIGSRIVGRTGAAAK